MVFERVRMGEGVGIQCGCERMPGVVGGFDTRYEVQSSTNPMVTFASFHLVFSILLKLQPTRMMG